MIGTGVGDALGAPFEGWPRVAVDQVGAVADTRQILTYTDDTHMMIGIAESLLRADGFNGRDMAETFIRNYQQEPFRGYGPGPPYVFRLITRGEAWDRASFRLYSGGSYGNGAAMRVAPIGVLYHNNDEKLRQVVYGSSQITHAHQLGKEGALLQASAVALVTPMVPTAAFDYDEFISRLAHRVSADIYRRQLDRIRRLLATAPDYSRVIAELGHGIEAFTSVPPAIYSFLAHPNSFVQAVQYAISLGGDTDTIGAMTGAIAGAYLGVASIPADWRDKLENYHYITELAHGLAQSYSRGKQEIGTDDI
jgi:poly(ADP-ribose) glycohydrolase ARH3